MTLPPIPIWLLTANGVAFADIPTRSGGRMPDFCIIGSAKCGTTSLDDDLARHPGIFCCRPKEPHYFSSSVMLDRGEAWYTGLYAEARPDQICGEASTSYTRWPLVAGTAERMFRANPKMKLIYIVRNPVERVQSELLQVVKYLKNVVGTDLRHLPLDAVLEMIEDPTSPYYSAVIETSKYETQVVEFERFFPTQQILILTQRTLRRHPTETLRQVQDFLGVKGHLVPPEGARSNVTADFLKGSAREQTTNMLRQYPFYALARRLLPRRMKDRILSRIIPPLDPATQTLSKDLRQRLEREFAPYNSTFAKRVGQPWTEW